MHQDTAWCYMKFLHILTGDERFEIKFEFSSKQPVTKWSLVNNIRHAYQILIFSLHPTPSPQSSPFLMDNIRLRRMPTASFEKLVIRYKYKFFISCLTSVFISANIIFYNFLEFHATLSEERICPKFSFF